MSMTASDEFSKTDTGNIIRQKKGTEKTGQKKGTQLID